MLPYHKRGRQTEETAADLAYGMAILEPLNIRFFVLTVFEVLWACLRFFFFSFFFWGIIGTFICLFFFIYLLLRYYCLNYYYYLFWSIMGNFNICFFFPKIKHDTKDNTQCIQNSDDVFNVWICPFLIGVAGSFIDTQQHAERSRDTDILFQPHIVDLQHTCCWVSHYATVQAASLKWELVMEISDYYFAWELT